MIFLESISIASSEDEEGLIDPGGLSVPFLIGQSSSSSSGVRSKADLRSEGIRFWFGKEARRDAGE